MPVVHPAATFVAIECVALLIYGVLGNREPYFVFRSEEALLALSAPAAVVVCFVFWSVETLSGIWRGTRSRWWIVAFVFGVLSMQQFCFFSMADYVSQMGMLTCR